MTQRGEFSNAVLVGLGDAKESSAALDWAGAEARLRGASVHIVRAYHWSAGVAPWETSADRMIARDLRHAAETRLRHAVAHLAETFPDVPVTSTAAEGIPWDVIVEHSADAAVTVLGSRRLGAVGGAVMGSVSTVVAARAYGPVVVVEGPPGLDGENPQVVVGVDGTPAGDEALGFAFDEASRRHRRLRAVYCWRHGLLTTTEWRAGEPAPERAQRWLAEAVAGWQEKYPDVDVRRIVVHEHPVTGLVQESSSQELLVVGGRPRHARVAPLLGSVSQGLLHHATCPVAVVHPRRTA